MSDLSDSESSKEEVEVGEEEEHKEKKEEENLDDDDDDLSWTSTDGVNEEEIVISSVTAEITPAQRFRRLFGLPAEDGAGGEGGGEGGEGGEAPAGGQDEGQMYIFDYIFAPPKTEEKPEQKKKTKNNEGCCTVS